MSETPVKLISISALMRSDTRELYALDDRGRTWYMDVDWDKKWSLMAEAPKEDGEDLAPLASAERRIEEPA